MVDLHDYPLQLCGWQPKYGTHQGLWRGLRNNQNEVLQFRTCVQGPFQDALLGSPPQSHPGLCLTLQPRSSLLGLAPGDKVLGLHGACTVSASSQPGWDVPAQHGQPDSWPGSTLQRGCWPCAARAPPPLASGVGQPGIPESFYWHLGPTEGGQPGLDGEGMGQSGENRVWNLLASLSACYPHTQALHVAGICHALPDIYMGNLRASPLHSLLKAAPLAYSQTMPIRSRSLTKEERGAQRGEVIHARSHSKDVLGPGFKPSSAACKAYKTLMSSSLPPGSLYSFSFPLFPDLPPPSAFSPPPFLVRVNNSHLTTAITPYLHASDSSRHHRL